MISFSEIRNFSWFSLRKRFCGSPNSGPSVLYNDQNWIAGRVRYNFLYISLSSSAKQQREMTKFCAFYGTWTTTAIFRISIWNYTLSVHIKPEQVFRAISVLNKSKRSQISLVKKIIF